MIINRSAEFLHNKKNEPLVISFPTRIYFLSHKKRGGRDATLFPANEAMGPLLYTCLTLRQRKGTRTPSPHCGIVIRYIHVRFWFSVVVDV
jgi:hypothetical protein